MGGTGINETFTKEDKWGGTGINETFTKEDKWGAQE